MTFAQSLNVRRLRPAELARELDVSRQSIHELQARGIIPTDADGLIDLELARVAIANRLSPNAKTALSVAASVSAPTPPAPSELVTSAGTITNFHVAKTLREATEARIAQLTLAEKEGNLVQRAGVERAAAKAGAELVAQLSPIPDRIAAEFGMDDEHRRRLRQRIREELDLARAALARLTDDEGPNG